MRPFTYLRAEDVASATALVAGTPGAQFIAGGTSQVDLMKEGVQRPSTLVDISRLPLSTIEPTGDGGLRIGANVSNARAAEDPRLVPYAAIREALHAGASQQIRNVATMGGNLLQRTRCPYLRDPAQRCNKRNPGSGCAAITGFNRLHAIFGQRDASADSQNSCIAAHPSDLAVALAAFDAVLVVHGVGGERRLTVEHLYRLPGDTPEQDVDLGPGDLITAVELPCFRGTSHYLKVRDRASYAYALVSCAVALEFDGGRIIRARVALGSVAAKPWRLRQVESMLDGQTPRRDLFEAAGVAAVEGARAYAMNSFKIALARTLVERCLLETAGLEPLGGPAGTALAASVGGLGGPGDVK